ncbi:farnesol dehydrogenase isoform X2 [Stomoxys calcitrans]|uniref:Dehydrogenase/reductase SDR family member 11 n=1 Tax=Stomoxys calcitrans TaxID=35570 RepID=A0A1I8Q698_STOCA|nr:farnesol dehydrogenase isoform X2 [Stomoxys calcitrans]
MERWRGKVAVVTGASGGIGWAICKELLNADMIVIGLARRLQAMEELKTQLPSNQKDRFFPRECDLTSLPSLRTAFHWLEQRFAQRMHVLINNAGMCEFFKLLDAGNDETLKQVIEVNLMGAVYCTKEAYRLMKKAMEFGEECHVINVNSLLGHTVPEAIPGCGFNLYPVAKHALRATNEVLRREMSEDKLLRLSVSRLHLGVDFSAIEALKL